MKNKSEIMEIGDKRGVIVADADIVARCGKWFPRYMEPAVFTLNATDSDG